MVQCMFAVELSLETRNDNKYVISSLMHRRPQVPTYAAGHDQFLTCRSGKKEMHKVIGTNDSDTFE